MSGQVEQSEWHAKAARVDFRNRAFVGGRFVDAASGETFDSVNPATGAILAQVSSCDDVDVNAAVTAARAAFESGGWSRIAPRERKRVLLRLAALVDAHREELALTDSLDMGKLVKDALAADVAGSVAVIAWYAEAVDKVYGEIAPGEPDHLGLITREPLGVVGAVVPWNFPLAMAVWKLAPALAAGNSVVLKPAEQSPLSALRLAELATEAGLPDGVLNVVPGFGERAGRALGLHPDVDCVAFTGSTEVGKLFLRYSAESNMKQVWLECGGKSANLVFADAHDLGEVAAASCAGFFYNQGEVCSANSRLLVERPVRDEVVARIAEEAVRFRPGDPLHSESTMGALVDERHTERVMSYIEAGKRTARLVCGGERVRVGGTGCFVEATVFEGVAPDDTIAREEIFGPVLSILEFDDEEEAVALANDSVYGLAASVWTTSLSRAHRLARRLNVGTVSVNALDVVRTETPFGGVKQSGFGRDLSLHALDKYCALKTTWIRY